MFLDIIKLVDPMLNATLLQGLFFGLKGGDHISLFIAAIIIIGLAIIGEVKPEETIHPSIRHS